MVTDARTGGTSPQAPQGRSRGLNIALWVLQVVTAVAFVMSAFAKFSGSPQAVGVFQAMGSGDWLVYLVGALELVGAIGLLIPRLCGLAATAFVALMVGALVTHAVVGGPALPAAVLLILSAILAWALRHRTMELLERTVLRTGRR